MLARNQGLPPEITRVKDHVQVCHKNVQWVKQGELDYHQPLAIPKWRTSLL